MNITVYLGSRCGNNLVMLIMPMPWEPGLPATATRSCTAEAGPDSWESSPTALCRPVGKSSV